jgi:hypothetical protein
MPCSFYSSVTILSAFAFSYIISSLTVKKSIKRHNQINTKKADKNVIKKKNPSCI